MSTSPEKPASSTPASLFPEGGDKTGAPTTTATDTGKGDGAKAPEGAGKPAEAGTTTAPKVEAKVDEEAKFSKKLHGFLRKAAAARQKIAVIAPTPVIDPKALAKNADKTEYSPDDFILQYRGLINLATNEELLFPVEK